MKEIFTLSHYKTHKPFNLFVSGRKTSKYGNNSLRALGPHIWNSFPIEIKKMNCIIRFKEFIKKWYGLECKCVDCKSSK